MCLSVNVITTEPLEILSQNFQGMMLWLKGWISLKQLYRGAVLVKELYRGAVLVKQLYRGAVSAMF